MSVSQDLALKSEKAATLEWVIVFLSNQKQADDFSSSVHANTFNTTFNMRALISHKCVDPECGENWEKVFLKS